MRMREIRNTHQREQSSLCDAPVSYCLHGFSECKHMITASILGKQKAIVQPPVTVHNRRGIAAANEFSFRSFRCHIHISDFSLQGQMESG